MFAECEECGRNFKRAYNEAWKRLCIPCWKQEKQLEPDQFPARQSQVDHYKALAARYAEEARFYQRRADALQELIQQRQQQFQKRLKSLIFFCHPDRNSNSVESSEITKWLLNSRALSQ